jgi:hypothetical protein
MGLRPQSRLLKASPEASCSLWIDTRNGLCIVSGAEVGDGGTRADNLGAGSGELEGKSSNVWTG